MTWVVDLTVDKKKYTAEFLMLPDHYADRIKCSGSYRFETRDDETDQVMDGELVVKALLVSGVVERAIVSGFGEHMKEQANAVERMVGERSAGGRPDQTADPR